MGLIDIVRLRVGTFRQVRKHLSKNTVAAGGRLPDDGAMRHAFVPLCLAGSTIGALLGRLPGPEGVRAAPNDPQERVLTVAPDLGWSPVKGALERYCIRCHGDDAPKAKLDLRGVTDDPHAAPLKLLRDVRNRLHRADMPPEGEPRPRPDEYRAAIAGLDTVLDRRATTVGPGQPGLRRLNRTEYRNTVRDLVGVDLDVARLLPADDVGEGFDHIGDVLSMAPVLLEKYLDVAEQAAVQAWPEPAAVAVQTFAGQQLSLNGGGRVTDQAAIVWSAGEAFVRCELPRDGRYRVRIRAFGDQAGEEPVKIAVRDGRERVAYFDIPETRAAPGARACEVHLAGGVRHIGVEFLNDFFDEQRPQGQRDRNLHLASIEVEGPLDRVTPTAEAQQLAIEGDELEPFSRQFLRRAFRRPVSGDELDRFVARVRSAVPPEASWPTLARTAMTAALVDPRFLFRVEQSDADVRTLDAYELATRLSYCLWSTMPDDALLAAAERGDLARDDTLLREVDRMLADPRALALAEQFGQQWLLIRDVEEKQPDASLFPGIDRSLLADMKAETTLFLDAMIREDRAISELMSADWTFLNERLATHYGIGGVDGAWMRRVRYGDRRVPGLLGHGSVLVATSNPSRTSPVKRGKWVLEAVLDEPPPPPPPGVPQLPEGPAQSGGATVRDLMARHRTDPGCAACHRRMDAIGLALEPLNAVGLMRTHDGDTVIDAMGDLPDGRTFDGPHELAAMLAEDGALTRSAARHLFVYALGRGLVDDDLFTVDRMARQCENKPTFRALLHAIVLTDQFRKRAGSERKESHP